MSKPLSLFFAMTAVALFVCTGVALSYQSSGLALFFFLAAFVTIGFGFYVKRKQQR